ncbi:MAG: ribosome recycling factor [Lentisphaeria bacterium]|jgi:ribosome recycling factor|nr:ribosome recycling factor [Lentisphaeria bacterium]
MNASTILDDCEEKMMAAMEALEEAFAGFRTGKATTSLVDNISVECYGSVTRVKEIAGVTTPEPRLIVVQPWDKGVIGDIEKALQSANIGITPVNDGRVIRLPIPELSEERRQDLAKQVKKRAEECKVEVRNHRRDANDDAKNAKKTSDITEDGMHDLLEGIQKLTDDYIGQIDDQTKTKEDDIMKV